MSIPVTCPRLSLFLLLILYGEIIIPKPSPMSQHRPRCGHADNIPAAGARTADTGEFQQRFDEADIEAIELLSVTVDDEPINILVGNQPRVNVRVGVPRKQAVPPDLAQRWDDQSTEDLGRDVVARVGLSTSPSAARC